MSRQILNYTDFDEIATWLSENENTLFVDNTDEHCYEVTTTINDESITYVTYYDDSSKNNDVDLNGFEANKMLEQVFKEETNKSFSQAFGISESERYLYWRPDPIMWISPNIMFNWRYKSVYEADYSSAYPFNATGRLPDARTLVYENGEIEPTAEYPFCFYSNGASAEYCRYDLRKLKDHPLRYNKNGTLRWIKSGEPIAWTIKFKKAKETLTSAIDFFYDLKSNGDPAAKAVMNKAIGVFQTKYKMNNQALIAIVTMCRHVYQMCSKFDALERDGNEVLMIATDCFIWQGSNTLELNKNKELGKLVLECENCDFCTQGFNNNIFEKDNKVIKLAHQGIKPKDINAWTIDQMISQTYQYYKVVRDGKYVTIRKNIYTGVEEIYGNL